MKRHSRVISLILAAVMLLTLTACSSKPKFNAEELTAAEQAAKTVLESIEFNKGELLTEVSVLQADNLPDLLGKEVGLSQWDISGAAYAVLFRVDKNAGSSDSSSAAPDTGDSAAPKKDTSRAAIALVSAENEVLYCSYARSESVDAPAVSYVDMEITTAQAARYELAQNTISVDQYTESHAEAVAAFEEAVAEQLTADPDYCYTAEYINTAKDMNLTQYINLLEQIRVNEYQVKALEEAESGPAESKIDKQLALATWLNLEQQRWALVGNLADTQAKLDRLTEKNADAIATFQAQITELQANDPNYLNSVDYLKLCLSNDTNNQYDVYLRQIDIYTESIDHVIACMAMTDANEMNHKSKVLNAKQEAESEYVNAMKTHAQCVVNKEAFEAENQEALAAYDSAMETAKQKVGDAYTTDMDFIKADVQYGEIAKQRDAHNSAVTESKKAADQVKADGEAEVAEIETAYAEKLKAAAIKEEKANLLEYAKALEITVSEYEVEAGQWGKLPQEYLDYQNPLLDYYVPKSSGSSYSSGSSSSSSSSSSNKGAGGYDMPNSSDKSFSDYVKRVDPDLYNSMLDRYNSLS